MGILDDINKIAQASMGPTIVGNVFKQSPIFSYIKYQSLLADTNAVYDRAIQYGYRGWKPRPTLNRS